MMDLQPSPVHMIQTIVKVLTLQQLFHVQIQPIAQLHVNHVVVHQIQLILMILVVVLTVMPMILMLAVIFQVPGMESVLRVE